MSTVGAAILLAVTGDSVGVIAEAMEHVKHSFALSFAALIDRHLNIALEMA